MLLGNTDVSMVSVELEAINASSLDYTQKIERERGRIHALLEKEEKTKAAVGELRAELAATKKKRLSWSASSQAHLESRLALLRTKAGEQTSQNVRHRARVDDLRLEKKRIEDDNVETASRLETAQKQNETVKQDLLAATQGLSAIRSKFESLKVATLNEIQANQAQMDSMSYQILMPSHSSSSSTFVPAYSPGTPCGRTREKAYSAGGSIHLDLLCSQEAVNERADDLEKLYRDREAVIDAMVTIHSLRDECGIQDDETLIAEFQNAENKNYDDCRAINEMLAQVAEVEQEHVVLQDEVQARQEHSSEEPDNFERKTTSSTADIEYVTKDFERKADSDEAVVESSTKLVVDILLTLTSKTKTKGDTLGLSEKPLTEMLAFIENAINTFVHFLPSRKQTLLPQISNNNTNKAEQAAPPPPTSRKRLSNANILAAKPVNGRPLVLPFTNDNGNNDEDEDDEDRPQSLDELRLRTKAKLTNSLTGAFVGRVRRGSRGKIILF